MTRNEQDIIDDMRNIVKPRIAKMLLEANFEGCGKEDKVEFETEFEIILTLAEKTLEQESMLDKIRAEILDEKEYAYADFEQYKIYYLGVDAEYVDDDLPQDDFRYGMERCIDIIDKYKAESEE